MHVCTQGSLYREWAGKDGTERFLMNTNHPTQQRRSWTLPSALFARTFADNCNLEVGSGTGGGGSPWWLTSAARRCLARAVSCGSTICLPTGCLRFCAGRRARGSCDGRVRARSGLRSRARPGIKQALVAAPHTPGSRTGGPSFRSRGSGWGEVERRAVRREREELRRRRWRRWRVGG